MHEIPILQYFREEAVRETSREHILEVLEFRLQPDAALAFKPALEAIDDLQRLDQLFSAAIRSDSVEDFQRALDANGK